MKRYQKRLSKLDIEQLSKSITAMKKTLDEYMGGEEQRYCALCEMVDRTELDVPVCVQCPWMVMKGVRCTGYLDRWWIYYHKYTHGIYSLRKGRNPRWTRMRIRQISKWIEVYMVQFIYKESIARRCPCVLELGKEL